MEEAEANKDKLQVLPVGPRVSLGPENWNLLAVSHVKMWQGLPQMALQRETQDPIKKQNVTIEGRNF